MSLSHILLGFLRKPASGYDLGRLFEKSARHFWSAELSQIYPTLKRMESTGWLTSETEPSPNGPDRRVYTRTEEGREELRSWLSGDPDMGVDRFAYLGQLFFMDELGDLEETERFVRALRRRITTRLGALTAIEREYAACVPGYPDDMSSVEFHRHATLRMGVHALSARLAWCDETLSRIDARRASVSPTGVASAPHSEV